MSVENKNNSEYDCPINDLPNELLFIIFEKLTVNEILYARLVSSKWNELISNMVINKIQISVNQRTLNYREEVLQKVLESFSNSQLPLIALKLIGIDFLITDNVFQLTNFGQQITELILDHVKIDEKFLFQRLRELENLQRLSILNCNIRPSDSDFFTNDILPRLQEITIDFIDSQINHEQIWGVPILQKLLKNNKARLTLRIRVLYFDDFDEANFVIQFSNRLKSLEIVVFHLKIFEQLCNAAEIDLEEFSIIGKTKIDFQTMQNIIENQKNLKKLIIEPKISDYSVQEIIRNMKDLKHLTVSFDCNEDSNQEFDFTNLESLELSYHKQMLSKIQAPNLKKLKIHPYKIIQKELDLIDEKFKHLTKLSVIMWSRKLDGIFDFTNCLNNLKNLEEFELIDEGHVYGNLLNRYRISIFKPDGISDHGKILRLKKLTIDRIFIDVDELSVIFERCPFIEDLSLTKCGFPKTLEVIDLVCLKLRNLKKICYSHENRSYCNSLPTNSVKTLLDCYPTLEKIEFEPKITPEGSTNMSRFFYNVSASIHTIREFNRSADYSFDRGNDDRKKLPLSSRISVYYTKSSSSEEDESENESDEILEFIRMYNAHYDAAQKLENEKQLLDDVIVISSDEEN